MSTKKTPKEGNNNKETKVLELTECDIEFLNSDGDEEKINTNKDMPINKAARKGDIKKILSLLEEGADINSVGDRWETPLISAVKGGCFEVVELLLSHNADTEAKDVYGNTALYNAIIWDIKGMAELLISKGVDLETKNTGGSTALQAAVSFSNVKLVNMMIKRGVNVKETNDNGSTALHMVYSSDEDGDIFEMLVKAGASVTVEDKDGDTPLNISSRVKERIEHMIKDNKPEPEEGEEEEEEEEEVDISYYSNRLMGVIFLLIFLFLTFSIMMIWSSYKRSNTMETEYVLEEEGAMRPRKIRDDDIGHDLYIMKKVKEEKDIIIYETGVKVKPPDGFYFDLVPRSSLYKHGYTLGNTIGIIDPNYRGTLKIVLRKMYEDSEELSLPFRAAQLVLRRAHGKEIRWKKVEKLDETDRGEDGFGSSGYK